MQEFWFCSSCKSMNRADARHCYKCRAPKQQATLATVAERSTGVVLTPGLDEEHREVAWTLMSGRRYVSAWKLGYVAAAMIILFVPLAAFVLAAEFWLVVANNLLDPIAVAQYHPAPTLSAVLVVAVFVLLFVAVLMVVLHSVFLGLTSMNAPALGSGTPRFGPVRAGLWWIESYLWSLWGLQTLWVIPYIVARAFGVLCGPIAAIGKPRRLLQDLMDRYGVPGSSDSRLVGFWSMAWGAARGIVYASYLLPLLVLITAIVLILSTSLLGIALTPAPPGQAAFFATLLVLMVVAGQYLAEGSGLFLLARITIELSRRQRRREAWVAGGLAHATPTVAAPGRAAVAEAPFLPPPGYPPPPGYGPQPLPQPPAQMAPEPPRSSYGSIYRTAPQPGPVPQAGLAPGSQAGVAPVLPAPDEPVAWSRKIERMVPQPDFAPLPPEQLPPAWLRAIRQSEAPVPKSSAPEATSPDPQAPLVEAPHGDLDIGSGI